MVLLDRTMSSLKPSAKLARQISRCDQQGPQLKKALNCSSQFVALSLYILYYCHWKSHPGMRGRLHNSVQCNSITSPITRLCLWFLCLALSSILIWRRQDDMTLAVFWLCSRLPSISTSGWKPMACFLYSCILSLYRSWNRLLRLIAKIEQISSNPSRARETGKYERDLAMWPTQTNHHTGAVFFHCITGFVLV